MVFTTDKKNLRLYFIPLEEAICFLNWGRNSPELITLPQLPQSVPDGAQVLSLRERYNPTGFDVLVYHHSFPEVADCEPAPREPGATQLVTRRIRTEPMK